MRIRIFRAPTLTEAIEQIRKELGADALILSESRRDGFVEVTAGLETDDAIRPETPAMFPAGFDDLEPFTVPAARPEQSTDRLAVLRWHGLPPALIEILRAGSLEQSCARIFRFARLRIGSGDAPLLLAGPPGSGKTLTVARLATRLVLAGQQPMVITADGKRAGAIEQLAAFTRLLGLTLVATNTPAMLARALERRADNQPVLIDAPGIDLDDPQQSGDLQALVTASGAATALVLPCGIDPYEAAETAHAHAGLGARELIATRTDPWRRLGGILGAAHAAGLALAEAGVGSAAADSLVPLTPAFLAHRLQGGDARADGRVSQHSALPLHIAAQRRAVSSS